jgi:probable phosphoglycerate mutase
MHDTASPQTPPTHPLRFVRHGATSANLAGLRCGGDLDLPLTDLGREQAEAAAEQIAQLDPPVGLIITSELQRTRETAAIIARRLRGVPLVVEAAFAERLLGSWNLQSIESTQAWLEARCTPPGGESDAEFTARIEAGLRRIARCMPRRPLLVGSKGVARVLGELSGRPGRLNLANGVVETFDGARLTSLQTLGTAA